MRRLWRTVLGQAVCAIITDGRHQFRGGWAAQGARAGQPLPMAHCTRCGAEF